MAEYIQSVSKAQTAFTVHVHQTKQTADSASYIVVVNNNKNDKGINYYFGKSSTFIGVQHNDGSGFKNIIVGSGVDDSRDVGKELKRWAFPKLSEWDYTGGLYKLYGDTLWGHFYPHYGDKETGFVTGSTVYSKEYTVKIDRGKNKQGFKTVQGKILGTSGKFASVVASLSLQTSKIASAKLDEFTLTQSDKNEKERKITVTVKITNPEKYYTLILKHGATELFKEKGASEICIDIPIDRQMFNSMQTFSVQILCENGEEEYSSEKSIQILPSGVGVSYKDEQVSEVEEIWYKDKYGNISEITEVSVKKGNQVVKTIK